MNFEFQLIDRDDQTRRDRRRFEVAESRRLYQASNRVAAAGILSIPAIVAVSIFRNSGVVQWLWLPVILGGVALFIRRMGTDAWRKAMRLRRAYDSDFPDRPA